MPLKKCSVCGADVESKYSFEGAIYFCKGCGLDRSKPIIDEARTQVFERRDVNDGRRDFPLNPLDPDPSEA